MSDSPRIYVADLAAYNSGMLHGVWIDATQELESIQEQIQAMLAYSPTKNSEEYAIHDFENFGSYRVGEFEGIESVHEVASFIAGYPQYGAELLDYFGTVDEARKTAEEKYCGCYKSVADYAEEMTEQTSEIPQHLAPYIDYASMARDWEMSGDLLTFETSFEEVHIFYSR